MAEKQWSAEDLEKATKPQLKELAQKLNIKPTTLKKAQLIEAIKRTIQPATVAEQVPKHPVDATQVPLPKSPDPNLEQNWQYQLELQKLAFERMKLEVETKQRELDREAKLKELTLQLETQQAAATNNLHAFKIDSAIKLLPKLASEQEIETYLITFEKIAIVNKWPANQWSAILQTQLRGKALKVLLSYQPLIVQIFRNCVRQF